MSGCRVCQTPIMESDYFCGTDCAFKDRLESTPLKTKLNWIRYIMEHLKKEDTSFYDCNSMAFDDVLKNLELLEKEEKNPTLPEEDEHPCICDDAGPTECNGTDKICEVKK